MILGFGFTSCTDVCPFTLATLAQAHKKLGAQAGEVQVIYITVDPERDDAARLRDYLAGFDPSFLGGTGTPEQLAAVRNEYGIAAIPPHGRRKLRVRPFVVHLPDRSRGKPARADALRAERGRLRARRQDPAEAVRRAAAHRLCSLLAGGRAGPGAAGRRWPRSSSRLRATRSSRFRRAPGRAAWPETRSRSCPSQIRLTLGVRDVLVLRNLDEVPQIFGPDADDAGPELPLAVRGRVELSIRLHGACERTDDHRGRAVSRRRRGRGSAGGVQGAVVRR